MDNKQIELSEKRRAYQGFFRIDVFRYRHSLYRGGMTPVIEREVFGRGQAVVVLLYDVLNETVVLIEQCRAGPLTWTDNQQAWLIEPVAGMIDQDETPLAACQREVEEEAGIRLSEFEPICQFYPTPGGCSEILHLYAAQVDSRALADYGGLADEVEDIRILKIPFVQAKQRLLAGEFNVASTIIALQWLFFQRLGKLC
jgi:ADP-ribose pyrophosphatase